MQEALALGDSDVRTDHVLLGLTRVEDGIAARILLDLGISPLAVAEQVRKELGDRPRSGLSSSSSTDVDG